MWEFATEVLKTAQAIASGDLFSRSGRNRRRQLRQARRIIRELLNDERWTMRSADIIHRRLRETDDAVIREALQREGAIGFNGRDGRPMYGLPRRQPT